MSKTPLTDAIQEAFNKRDGMCVDDIVEAYEHARGLERANAALAEAIRPRRSLDDYDDVATVERVFAECAALKEELTKAQSHLAGFSYNEIESDFDRLCADNAALRAEVEDKNDVLERVGKLTEFMSETYPERAGQHSTDSAIDEIKKLLAEVASRAEMVSVIAQARDKAETEVEMLREACAGWRETVRAVKDELMTERQRAERASQDTARMDWLEQHQHNWYDLIANGITVTEEVVFAYRACYSARAAIDTARAATGGNET